MEKQGLLMRGCWRKCWQALQTFSIIENTKTYYGNERFINMGMLLNTFETIGNIKKYYVKHNLLMQDDGGNDIKFRQISKHLKIQRNTMDKQGLLSLARAQVS